MPDMLDAARSAGAPIQAAVATFMLHPETFAGSVAAGYQNPFAGYVAGRGGVLGEATGDAVSSVFVVFEPTALAALWDEGVAVRGAGPAADLYWQQTADFGRKYLASAEGLDRITALGEKLIATAPARGVPLFAGWRMKPLADDPAARVLQVWFILRELRAGLHFNALTLSSISPIEAHMLNKGHDYAVKFGWPEPFADGRGKEAAYEEVEKATNRRMAELFTEALTPDEADEFARLCTAAHAAMMSALPG